jgi:hypothetical protein
MMTCAQIYAETRDALQDQGKDKEHEVYVLRGGFGEFQAKFKASFDDMKVFIFLT